MPYRLVKATLLNNDVATADDAVAESGRPKNRTCNVLDINSSTPLHSTHSPVPHMQDNVLIVSANVVWTQRQKSVVNGTKLRAREV